MSWQLRAPELEPAKLCQVVGLHLVGHRHREVKIGHQDEVDDMVVRPLVKVMRSFSVPVSIE